jgi:hypothetical protein
VEPETARFILDIAKNTQNVSECYLRDRVLSRYSTVAASELAKMIGMAAWRNGLSTKQEPPRSPRISKHAY